VLTRASAEEAYWDTVGDHLLRGEDTKPPKGYHSTQRDDAYTRVVPGAKNPANAGDNAAYKQWHCNKTDAKREHPKVSTFFPDGWPEDKIRAAVLLRNAGADHEVEAHFGLKQTGDTIYPDVAIEDPTKPAKLP
jgi:hypothetical protein